MKFSNLIYSLVGFCLLFFASCKNDLKINAPYKEIPTIYAVLNPQETIQMIRVNKVFLGEGNANEMAQVADSINYQAGDLAVTLERFVNGTQVAATPTGNKLTIVFRDSVIQANPGAFNTTQRVYVSSDRLFVTGQYVLKVKNNKTSKIFTAKANAIDSIPDQNVYAPFGPHYYPVPAGSPAGNPDFYPDYSTPNLTYSMKFKNNEAAIYTVVLRFHFFDSLNDGSKEYKFVDYNFGNQYIKDMRTFSFGKLFAFDFRKADLFNSLGFSLAKMNLSNAIPGRKMYKMEPIIYTSTQEYVDYLQFTAPSLSIAQEKPIYSNFENREAMGIFTFRTRRSVFKEMASTFISEFSFNPSTCKFHFFTSAGIAQNWCN
ncbi:MAG: hypothetical protein Q7W45_06135 [Bacteroidota bacterium]|nr:hypothetical protein [Bacteroidota bacterium]MDP3145027.1 hypothetical protein [Bacteroidota bacterium]